MKSPISINSSSLLLIVAIKNVIVEQRETGKLLLPLINLILVSRIGSFCPFIPYHQSHIIFAHRMSCCMKANSAVMEENGVTLLIIDAQNDFANPDGGSLYVENADNDMERICSLISNSIDSNKGSKVKFDRIVASLDTHNTYHIAHPQFWVDEKGDHPVPFTVITKEAVESEKWKPSDHAFKHVRDYDYMEDKYMKQAGRVVMDKYGNFDLAKYCIYYSKKLEEGNQFKIIIWPEHCLENKEGNKLVSKLQDVLSEWEVATKKNVEIVRKGRNNLTEMYSALKAEVSVSQDTDFNQTLFDSLNKSSKIVVVGEAKSHCVNYTVRDMLSKMTDEEKSKIYLLSDCSSTVGTYEKDADRFERDLKKAGGHVITSDEIEMVFQ
jgi:nicotinamidase-related amidase